MFKEKLILTFYAQTPIHMGSGVSVSYVDNPIQREKHTDFPILASSGIKGVIRDLAERVWNSENKVDIIFGPKEEAQQYGSCIAFTDAKILLYPVRSVKGVFSYITSPYVLKRFKNELKSIGKDDLPDIPQIDVDKILVHSNSKLKIDNNTVALEEFVFSIDNSKNIDDLTVRLSSYLSEEVNLKDHFAIVSDNTFTEFVKYAVEIRTRIRIDQTTGTAAGGALFTVELVPSESVFYGFLFITDPYKKDKEIQNAQGVKNEIKTLLNDKLIQFGGDETLGMGLMKVKCIPCESQKSQSEGTNQ